MATTNLSEYKKINIAHADKIKIGIVFSNWNAFATHNMRDGAMATLLAEGVPQANIDTFAVPGAFELIFGAKKLIATQDYDAVIAIGCVIRGETAHFDFICSGVTQGIKDLNLQAEIPTIFCVLTDENKAQSVARSGGEHGNKGVEAAATALEMIKFNRNF